MAEYIEREALKADLRGSYEDLLKIYHGLTHHEDKAICGGQLATFLECILRVKDAPAADVAPVEPAHWICRVILDYWDERKDRRVWACSNCGTEEEKRRKFCAECGRKMDEEG